MPRPVISATLATLLVASTVTTAPPAQAARSTRPLAGKVVVLDPGHNGRNQRLPASCNSTGTETPGHYAEHALTWDVAKRTRARLRALGARVVLTRPNDTGTGPCAAERGRIANRAGADVFVSIHADGGPSTVRGLHVIWNGGPRVPAAMRPRNARFAEVMRTALVRATGMPPARYIARGTGVQQRSDLANLNVSKRPSVLVEVGNMRNPTDIRLVRSAAFREREAIGIVNGIRAYLGR